MGGVSKGKINLVELSNVRDNGQSSYRMLTVITLFVITCDMIHGDKTKSKSSDLQIVLFLPTPSRLFNSLPVLLTEHSAVPGVESGSLVLGERGINQARYILAVGI